MFNQDEINELIENCGTQDLKTFTLTLKGLHKKSGSRFFIMGEEGQEVFNKCRELFSQSSNPIIQYNTLRLAKYGVDHPKAIGKKFWEPWELYLKTIFHPDGRVRAAGVQFLERYYCGLAFDIFPYSKQKKTKVIFSPDEVGRFIVGCYFYLQNLEKEYLQENWESLDDDDLPDVAGGQPWASDTKDKYLKSIRMGLEAFACRGPLDKLMDIHNHPPKQSEVFENYTIFQRYEASISDNIAKNTMNLKTYIIRAKLEDRKRIYRDIELPENTNLYSVAKAILDAFEFNFDHLFGFGNKPGYYHSNIQYELKTEDDLYALLGEENTRGDVKKTTIAEVPFFTQTKDKMYFLFDFGDDWSFEIELRDFQEVKKDKEYPVILKVNGEAPEQYPEWD